MLSRDRSQQRFFEEDPRRLATVVFRNPRYPRNLRKKIAFVGDRFAGCERVLEIGTGRGLQLSFLLARLDEEARYAGLDVALGPLQAVRAELTPAEVNRVILANGEAEALPFADRAFDGAFCLDVLHHVTSQAAMLTEIRRVLRPGGAVLCVEPNLLYPVNLLYVRDPIERKLFELTPANVRSWTTHAGLTDVRLTNLPVFFPSFPRLLAPLYEHAERLLGRIPGLNRLSTTRVLMARRPDTPTGNGGRG